MAPAERQTARARRPQARGIARREAILDAAVRLFSQRGFRGTGILGLAEEVGISHAGLLHHFGTKQQLLLDVVARRDRQQAELIEHLRGLRGLEGLRAIQKVGEDNVTDALHARLFIVLIGENLRPEDPLNDYFRARYQRVRTLAATAVRTGQADGEIRPDADPEAIAAEVMAFIAGMSIQWLLDPDAVDVPAAYRHYLERLIDDLTAHTPSRAG